MKKYIVLIHAVPTAIGPMVHAFREGWPEAELSNLMDDGLLPAFTRAGGMNPPIIERICELTLYAARTGADGILFTCSSFPQAIDLAKQMVPIPVLKPDEAMFSAALDAGKRIGLVATNAPAIPVSTAQLQAAAAMRGMEVEVKAELAAGAFAAGNAGDSATHDRLVVEAVGRIAGSVDVICLAQASMAAVRAQAQGKSRVPVLASPGTAVARLKMLLAKAPR